MKIGLSFKLGVLVVVSFTVIITGLILKDPLETSYYMAKMNSRDKNDQIRAVDYFLSPGGEKASELAKIFTGGKKEVDFLAKHWKTCTQPIKEDDIGRFPLHLAAEEGFQDAARLLAAKTDVNIRNRYDSTPLHLAALKGNCEMTILLISLGANINARNRFGWTPLHMAAQYGKIEAARALIINKAELNAKDHDGRTALHLAVQSGRAEFCSLLISSESDINAKDKSGSSALHHAVLVNEKEIVTMLLSKGAKPNLENNFNETPLDIAKAKGEKDIMEILLGNGAKYSQDLSH